MNVFPLRAGRLTGLVAEGFDRAPIVDQFGRVIDHCTSAHAERISAGSGDHVVRGALVTANGEIPVAVKVFGRQPWWKDRYDRWTVSKAERSFRAACFLSSKKIGTPEPIAWLERWEGSRLRESYFLCRFESAPSFRMILSDILWNQRRHEPLMDVLRHLAPAIRAMHDAGFMHGDMGNQNILLPRSESGEWLPPQMIDLNRCKVRPRPLSDRERAHDLARIALPGAYVQVFKRIYSGNSEPTARLSQLERTARRRFWRHRRYSRWRHPIRYWRNLKARRQPAYPEPRDTWLWDEESSQPVRALEKREERRQRHWPYSLYVLWKGLCAWPGVHRLYRRILAESFAQPRTMSRRIGVALHPHRGCIEKELELHRRLGRPPALVRFYHHETPAERERGIALVERLAQDGTPVMIGLVQDRRAVLEPSSWAEFLNGVVRALVDRVTCIEVTHATDRVHWGVWKRKEYLSLLEPALALKREIPKLKLSGPACDAPAYRSALASLASLPDPSRFDAFSHLLHPEPPGAPERGRGRASTLEQCAMLKAIARWSPHTEEEVIVSGARLRPEPLDGLRIGRGEAHADDAGRMLRFLAVALCSGHVDRVYWSRLSAHEHGLVDDRDGLRPRTVFRALAFFLELLGSATFQRRHGAGEDVHVLEFAGSGRRMLMGWCRTGERKLDAQFEVEQSWDAFGQPVQEGTMGESPRYFLLAGGAGEPAKKTRGAG